MQSQVIRKKIYDIRNCKVILDKDLASLYETPTKSLNLSVKRNIDRFPSDFMFQLTSAEFDDLRFQFETSSWGGTRHLLYAFTELGIAMLSSVLNSKKAIQVNIAIMRTFVLLREYAFNYKETSEKIAKLERKYNRKFKDIYEALDLLLQEKPGWENRERIGFKK